MKLSTNDIQRWIYFNCARFHNWVVFQNLDAILKYSEYQNMESPNTSCPPISSREDIIYIYAVNLTQTSLMALLETSHGFYFIDNQKQEILDPETQKPTGELNVISTIKYYHQNLNKFVSDLTKKQRETLGIQKTQQMKINKSQKQQKILPYHFKPNESESDQHTMLDIYLIQQSDANSPSKSNTAISPSTNPLNSIGHLDLSDVTGISTQSMTTWKPQTLIHELTLQSCYQIRDFEWLDTIWAQNLKKLTLINMTQITNDSLTHIVKHLPNLKEFYVFSCPQVNIKCLLKILDIDRLTTLCLNDPNMACQPNEYSGLITETEWEKFRNRSLTKLLINSSNISVDIIDYLRKSLLSLETLILHPSKYNYLKESLVNQGSESARQLTIASTDNKAIKLGADFVLKNLLKHRYSAPFSKSMLKVMERIRAQEFQEDLEEEQNRPACPVDIHKT